MSVRYRKKGLFSRIQLYKYTPWCRSRSVGRSFFFFFLFSQRRNCTSAWERSLSRWVRLLVGRRFDGFFARVLGHRDRIAPCHGNALCFVINYRTCRRGSDTSALGQFHWLGCLWRAIRSRCGWASRRRISILRPMTIGTAIAIGRWSRA